MPGTADMFLDLGDVGGESQDLAHKGEIDVLAWSWGMSNSGTMHVGMGGGSGKVAVQDLSITKFVDKSSTNLYKKCCDGKHYEMAKLTVRKAGGDVPVEYMKIHMEKVMITSMSSVGAGSEERVTENCSLNFKKVTVMYTPQEPDGSAGATMEMWWDIEQNTGG